MKEPIRVLHVLQRMEAGGTQALLMNIYRNIDRTKVQFDFLVEYPDKQFYDDEIIKLGGKIYYTNVRKDYNIIKFKNQLKKILKSDINYKIIHVHAYTIGYFVLKTAKKCGVPIRIAHSHSNSMTKNLKTPIKKILRKLYTKYATDLFACSNEAGKFLYGDKEFKVLKNAIDSQKFIFSQDTREKVRKKFGLSDSFVVGHVGRFKPEKNQSFLIDVFNEIKMKKKNAKLILVGDGPQENNIRQKVLEHKLENDVIFLKNRNDVNEIYMGMDVFVFPSLYEGLGIVAIEAQATGLPVLASNRIPAETFISPIIKKLDINDNPIKWADLAISIKPNKRENMRKFIIEYKYDIIDCCKNIQEYYINKYKKYNQ